MPRKIGYLALLGLGLLGAPVQALTPAEAALINMEIGFGLCLVEPMDGPTRAQTFRQAGFAERVEGDAYDRTHYFSAPAGTAEVEFYWGQLPSHCVVASQFVDVTAASGLLDKVLPRVLPNYNRVPEFGPPSPSTRQAALCVSYLFPNHPLGIGYAIVAADGSGICRDGVGSKLIGVGGP